MQNETQFETEYLFSQWTLGKYELSGTTLPFFKKPEGPALIKARIGLGLPVFTIKVLAIPRELTHSKKLTLRLPAL
jgi:hypothetical protein